MRLKLFPKATLLLLTAPTLIAAAPKQVETIIPPFGTLPVTPAAPPGGWVSARDNFPDSRDSKQGVMSVQTLERAVYQQVNQYRRSRNLPALVLDERLSQQAREHSQAMANGSVPFSHNGFEQRVRAIAQIIPNRGTAENVAYNEGYSDPIAQALAGWIASDGHRRNMEETYSLTGIGVAQNSRGQFYFTQIFVRR